MLQNVAYDQTLLAFFTAYLVMKRDKLFIVDKYNLTCTDKYSDIKNKIWNFPTSYLSTLMKMI